MIMERFIKRIKSLLPTNETPKKSFYGRYDAQAFYRQAREVRRTDLFGLSEVGPTSQDYCDAIAKDINSLLTKDERRAVGNFYVGLSDEAFLSCTVEPVGNSFLIVIHRRLFNALQFFTHIYVSSILSREEKIILLSEYLFAITSGSSLLNNLPVAPTLHSKREAEEGALLEGNLIRFLVGHELYHTLPSINGNFDLSPLPPEKRVLWGDECEADYFSVTLMLREQAYDPDLLQRYRTATVQAPVFLFAFLNAIECLHTVTSPITNQSHPSALLRNEVLSVNLTKNFPYVADLLQYTHTIAQPLFEKVQNYISENMVTGVHGDDNYHSIYPG